MIFILLSANAMNLDWSKVGRLVELNVTEMAENERVEMSVAKWRNAGGLHFHSIFMVVAIV